LTIIIPFYKPIVIYMLCCMPLVLTMLILHNVYESKYTKHKEEYDYQKKYNPNFERQQKLERIINGNN